MARQHAASAQARSCTLAVMVLAVLPLLVACDSFCERLEPARAAAHPRDAGYGVLRTLLGDEQHIDTLRLIKSVITFRDISDPTRTLIDDIATTSSRGLTELDRLVTLRPAIVAEGTAPDRLGSEILDALRVTTARDLITASRDDFETDLVISQIQALRLIGQLLRELRELDPNSRRQTWLAGLAGDYDDLYGRAVARLSIKAGK